MSMRPTEPADIIAAVQAYRETKKKTTAAVKLKIPEMTLTHRIKVAIRDGYWTGDMKDEPVEPEVFDFNQPLARNPKHDARDIKVLQATIAELRARVRDLEWSSGVAFEPAEWTRKPSARKQGSAHVGYLLTSDLHVGERIEPQDAGLMPYNEREFVRRYRHLVSTTIELASEHVSADWKMEGFIYARGGDVIAGSIHDELRETNSLTPLESIELAFEEEAAGIAKLADAFGKVEVKTLGAGGNHDRDTLKMHHKRAAAHSYDRLVAFMLAREFKRDKRVTVQTSAGFDLHFDIYDQNVLLTHGDRIGSRGGQGFIGPAATILRGVQKVRAEQAALGNHVGRVDIGHFHYPLCIPSYVLSNGSLPGYSEYGKAGRMAPVPPQQWLVFHNAKHGAVDFRPVRLG